MHTEWTTPPPTLVEHPWQAAVYCIWENAGSHCRKSSYRTIRGRNYESSCGWSFRNRWNRNGTTCLNQTWKGFPCWFRRLEWCDLHRTKWIRWAQGFSICVHTLSCRTHTFFAWRTDIAYARGSSVWKRCLQCACRISPSRFLCPHVSPSIFAVPARSLRHHVPVRTVFVELYPTQKRGSSALPHERRGVWLPGRSYALHNLDRALRFSKKRPLRNWRRFQQNEIRKKIFTALLQCIQGSEAFWDINVSQSRTQFQCCYKLSRCASMAAASPTIGDVKARNKLARQIKSQPVKFKFWPLTGPLRILGFPDACYRNNHDGSSQRMTVFLAESRERPSEDGTSYGSLIDYESQRIERTVLSTTTAELFSFMKCVGSSQFLRGFWIDRSCQVANIHMRTEAKNLVTTARTIHLSEPKETIHMIPVMRKEACSMSIHDIAHIPTRNCLAHCLTKASAKADNLITAVKTGRLLDVDIHPDFRTLMEQLAFLSTWCSTFMHTSENDIFFLNALRISLAPTPREGPFYLIFVVTQHTKEQKRTEHVWIRE